MKFKVGDRVRIVRSAVFNHKIDDVGRIVEIDGICIGVDVKGSKWWYSADKMVLVKKHNFKKPLKQIRHILSRHISNKKKMELIAEIVASNQT